MERYGNDHRAGGVAAGDAGDAEGGVARAWLQSRICPRVGGKSGMTEEEINELLQQFPEMRELVAHLLRRHVDTILNVGGRGYYENPMSDLLAFFLDPSACHGLGDLVLSTLLRSLERNDLNPILTGPPIREDVNRIDIVLPGENFVIAIENKIHHGPNNPFDAYREAINRQYAKIPEKNRIFCLLAPRQPHPAIPCWQWLDTRRLIALIWEELGHRQRHVEHTKWVLLLQEFLKTVEQEIEIMPIMNNYQFRKIAAIYEQFTKFERLRWQFIDSLKQKLIELALQILPIGSLSEKVQKWGNAIALSILLPADNLHKVSFLLYDGQVPNEPRYAIQLYSLAELASFPHVSDWQETVNGNQLYVYRNDYNDLDAAFGGFQQALTAIL
jgi:hypothetical protein